MLKQKALRVRELCQERAEADAAFAGQCDRLGVGALFRVGAGKADADLIAAEHRALALARRMFVVDEFAPPPAVRARIGADIVEEGIAAAHLAVVQDHDTCVASVDTVEHADVDRIEAVLDARLLERRNGRRGSFAERRDQHVERDARQLRDLALEAMLLALRPAPQRHRDFVGLQERPEIRIEIVPDRCDLDDDLAVLRQSLRADEAKDRVPAEDPVIIAIDDAAARPVHGRHVDLVKSLQHGSSDFAPSVGAQRQEYRGTLPAPRARRLTMRKPVLPRRISRQPRSRPLSIKRIVAPETYSRAKDNPDRACGSNPSSRTRTIWTTMTTTIRMTIRARLWRSESHGTQEQAWKPRFICPSNASSKSSASRSRAKSPAAICGRSAATRLRSSWSEH